MHDETLDEMPTRAAIDAMPGAVVVEFGAEFCGHCQRARPQIAAALQRFAGVRHLRIEDGPGQRLGRSFRVTLWPTLIFLLDGQEQARLVRPVAADEVDKALQTIAQRA